MTLRHAPAHRLVAAALLLAACRADRPPIPGYAVSRWTPVEVVEVTPRGSFLDARVLGERVDLRFFFPRSEDCDEVLRAGARIEYGRAGPLGRVRDGGRICEPMGIASLAAWRDRRPKARGSRSRSRASFEPFYEDDDVVLVRGRFPAALRIGWTGAYDTLAVLPNTSACRPMLERGFGSIEYSARGSPFVLIGEEHCPVIGFVLPPHRPFGAGARE